MCKYNQTIERYLYRNDNTEEDTNETVECPYQKYNSQDASETGSQYVTRSGRVIQKPLRYRETPIIKPSRRKK